jgi:hypothetical protein
MPYFINVVAVSRVFPAVSYELVICHLHFLSPSWFLLIDI